MSGQNATTPKRHVNAVWGGSRGSKVRHGKTDRSVSGALPRIVLCGHTPRALPAGSHNRKKGNILKIDFPDKE